MDKFFEVKESSLHGLHRASMTQYFLLLILVQVDNVTMYKTMERNGYKYHWFSEKMNLMSNRRLIVISSLESVVTISIY